MKKKIKERGKDSGRTGMNGTGTGTIHKRKRGNGKWEALFVIPLNNGP